MLVVAVVDPRMVVDLLCPHTKGKTSASFPIHTHPRPSVQQGGKSETEPHCLSRGATPCSASLCSLRWSVPSAQLLQVRSAPKIRAEGQKGRSCKEGPGGRRVKGSWMPSLSHTCAEREREKERERKGETTKAFRDFPLRSAPDQGPRVHAQPD